MSTDSQSAVQPPILFPEAAEAASRPVQVGPDQNIILVRADQQQWISVVRDGVELVRESGGKGSAEFLVAPGEYEVRTDGRLGAVEAGQRDLPASPVELSRALPAAPAAAAAPAPAAAGGFSVRLQADAPSRHPADGMPQVPADGSSRCRITVQKTDGAGEPVRGRQHDDEIFLRSTGGSLMDTAGKSRVRSIRLRSGKATFQLVAENAPKLVTVHAFAADPQVAAELSVEFV
jgi:hypothetical protein